MSQIEVYILENGLCYTDYIEVPANIKKSQSQDAFLNWLYISQGSHEAPITTLFHEYSDIDAVFVANWLEDSDESIN
jgi:hypothetical protein